MARVQRKFPLQSCDAMFQFCGCIKKENKKAHQLIHVHSTRKTQIRQEAIHRSAINSLQHMYAVEF